ncbi:phytoene/squalene synthase family protein [Polyangium aurulentum]|uniref:phytoene/squalene synthase family protein n=1 Tax=Polyangium aurulentum TaxID=2567896 RepID=UPI0010AE2A9E|nr:phytoene/squalene synthase family protein [Polyangium aurulentum]UQA55163.1 squalene/phytoene synthase family protein [Polyangium aurulentum]
MAKPDSYGSHGLDLARQRTPARAASPEGEGAASAHEALAREDRAFNEQVLPLVSRTFALSILSLPTSLREAVGVAYLLCRIVDSIEDARGMPAERRRTLFDHFDALLEDDTADPEVFERATQQGPFDVSDAEKALCRRAGTSFRRFRALPGPQRESIRSRVREMSRGMRSYAARADAEGTIRLRDMADLEQYCYYVAGTVGELLTALFEGEVPSIDEATRKELRVRSVPFGLGLQIVNIVKDVAEDAERGVCYLPTEVLAKHGTSVERILAPEDREKALAALFEVCALGRKHLEAAAEYTLLWPAAGGAEVRTFCAVPLALALATLREVERGTDCLLRGREPKIDRALVAEILAGARRAADADGPLARLFARASSAPGAPPPAAPARSTGPLLRARRPPTPPVPRYTRKPTQDT